jgi:hypothetical protein
MTASRREHRLDGLEPDNLLAFLAMLGLLRALETARPDWRPRVRWSVDEPPVRPVLATPAEVDEDVVATAAAEGVAALAAHHAFDARDLSLSQAEARGALAAAAEAGGAAARLWAALTSDAALARDGVRTEPTPLCLLFGQGHQHFLERLAAVPRLAAPERSEGRRRVVVTAEACIAEALFEPWTRPDATPSFRWDPHEDVRYALRATDPTDAKTKETTQHGANRLAAIGLAEFTVAPETRGGRVRLSMRGAVREPDGAPAVRWPIWRAPVSLAAIRAMLSHPRLDDIAVREALGVVEMRRARRISVGKFMNFTRAQAE